MSMHNTPLTDLEREGLNRHLLAIEYPSQLADVFRQGMAWALSKPQSTSQDALDASNITEVRQYVDFEVNVKFLSCRAAGAFKQYIDAAMKEDK